MLFPSFTSFFFLPFFWMIACFFFFSCYSTLMIWPSWSFVIFRVKFNHDNVLFHYLLRLKPRLEVCGVCLISCFLGFMIKCVKWIWCIPLVKDQTHSDEIICGYSLFGILMMCFLIMFTGVKVFSILGNGVIYCDKRTLTSASTILIVD